MKLISHRGNINGRIVERENSLGYIVALYSFKASKNKKDK